MLVIVDVRTDCGFVDTNQAIEAGVDLMKAPRFEVPEAEGVSYIYMCDFPGRPCSILCDEADVSAAVIAAGGGHVRPIRIIPVEADQKRSVG